jgi:hypothetical protein
MIVKDLLLYKGAGYNSIMELHHLVSLCSNEKEAFYYLFQKKKELPRNFCPH